MSKLSQTTKSSLTRDKEGLEASLHPTLDPLYISNHVENDTFWQPIIHNQAASKAQLQKIHDYVQATFCRPTSEAGYTVTCHPRGLTLAEDDPTQVTVTSLQTEIASLRRKLAVQGGCRPLPVRGGGPRALSVAWGALQAPPREGVGSVRTTRTSAMRSLGGPAMQSGGDPAHLALSPPSS